ncbi:MAG: hypothetical protein ACP5KW_08855 [Thermoproteota archaeon]|jgi:hypothetical protein
MSGMEKSGLTFRSVLAIVFAATILMPVTIWMQLVGGQVAGLGFATILFFIFIIKYFGRNPLTPQEIILINIGIGIAAYVPFFATFINRTYFAGSPEAYMFGIARFIPSWWVPENTLIRSQAVRTLLSIDWLVPIAISLITSVVLYLPMQLLLGYIAYQTYVVEENLMFPLAKAEAETAITLGESEPSKTKLMLMGFIITFLYSLIVYWPYILGPVIGVSVSVIPVPFADFTSHTEHFLPGALIGIATDPFTFFNGFIIPEKSLLCMVVGSIAVWIIGNMVGITYFKSEFLPEWTSGFSLALTYQRSFLHTWASVMIGFSLAIAVMQLIDARKSVAKAMASLKRIGGSKASSFWYFILMYIACSSIWVLLSHLLLPDFPVFPLAFLIVIWPFVTAIINARALGEVGYPVATLPMREMIYIATLTTNNVPVYSNLGVGVWFLPLPSTVGVYPSAETWVTYFYTAKYVGLSVRDVVKVAIMIAVPLSLIMSFIYTNVIWSFSPIPSQAYPWAAINWPIGVIQNALWITRSVTVLKSAIINPGTPPLLEGSFVVMTLVYAAVKVTHLPFSPVAFVVGCSTLPPYAITALVGYIVYKAICSRFGKDVVDKSKWPFYAGVFIGYGSATAMLITLAIGLKAMWMLPY